MYRKLFWLPETLVLIDMSKTILVTGGAGFIGSNFVRAHRRKHSNDRILVLDLLTYAGSVENIPQQDLENGAIEFHYGDIRNASLVDSLVARSDLVVHFAAETHVTRSIYDNYHFFETDVLGTQVLANSVIQHIDRVERFVHVSTSEVYGTALSEKMSEAHPLLPLSPYASAKVGADRLVYSYWATYRLPVVILRPFNNYGPRQHLEKAIARFVTSCLLNEPIRIHGDGLAQRDWTYVDDTCEAIGRVLDADIDTVVGEVFNIGSGKSVSIVDVAKSVIRETNVPDIDLEFVGDRPGQVFRHTADARKLERLLGWTSSKSFEEGLRQTIKWYQTNRVHWDNQRWMRDIPIVSTEGKPERH